MTLGGKALASAALLAPALLLVACDGGSGSSSGPGAVSEGEARALDEAAEMLEERQLPEGVLPTAAPGAETTPQDGATAETEQTEPAQ